MGGWVKGLGWGGGVGLLPVEDVTHEEVGDMVELQVHDYRHSGLGQSSMGVSPGEWVGKGVGGGKGWGGGGEFLRLFPDEDGAHKEVGDLVELVDLVDLLVHRCLKPLSPGQSSVGRFVLAGGWVGKERGRGCYFCSPPTMAPTSRSVIRSICWSTAVSNL